MITPGACALCPGGGTFILDEVQVRCGSGPTPACPFPRHLCEPSMLQLAQLPRGTVSVSTWSGGAATAEGDTSEAGCRERRATGGKREGRWGS